ncbi:MAG: hypothetical protein JJ958_03225 [Balneola sp.]|jgi:hypothetical protein|nr:hypothetical protein [Balneola sp.]
MEFLNVLSREEMRNIKGGNACADGCLSLYGGYYEECDSTFPPSTDGRSACFSEVHELNMRCIGWCFE